MISTHIPEWLKTIFYILLASLAMGALVWAVETYASEKLLMLIIIIIMLAKAVRE